MSEKRVLLVYGSESNTAKRNIERIAKEWMAREGYDWSMEEPMTGNEAASLTLETIGRKYDCVLVATSSFRQGDAPANYDDFLEALYRGGDGGENPLSGVQSAVLGFGDSNFDTYMNCPRLTDMMLEKCGARRLAQRREINVRATKDDREADMTAWADDVFASIQAKTSYTTPKVCDWETPGDGQTFDKSLEYLAPEPEPEKGGVSPLLVVAVAGAALAIAYVAFF